MAESIQEIAEALNNWYDDDASAILQVEYTFGVRLVHFLYANRHNGQLYSLIAPEVGFLKTYNEWKDQEYLQSGRTYLDCGIPYLIKKVMKEMQCLVIGVGYDPKELS